MRQHYLPRGGTGRDLAAAFAALDLVDRLDGTGPQHRLDFAAAELHLDQAREAVARLLAESHPEQMRAELLRAAALLLG